MIHIYLQALEIRDIKAFNSIINALIENEILMKQHHFDMATTGITINAKNKEAVRRVIVGGEQITKVAESIDMKHSQLSRQVSRVLKNFAAQLKAQGLICESWVVGKDLKGVLDGLEDKSVKAAKAKPKKKTAKKKKA